MAPRHRFSGDRALPSSVRLSPLSRLIADCTTRPGVAGAIHLLARAAHLPVSADGGRRRLPMMSMHKLMAGDGYTYLTPVREPPILSL